MLSCPKVKDEEDLPLPHSHHDDNVFAMEIAKDEPSDSMSSSYEDPGASFNLDEILNKEGEYDIPEDVIDGIYYPATIVPAMLGKHDVYYYRLYGETDLCYSFQWKRDLKSGGKQSYVCGNCKFLGRTIKIEVADGKFIGDPTLIGHVCNPIYWPAEAAKRRFFNATKRLRNAGDDSEEKPAMAFRRMVDEVMNDSSLTHDERLATLDAIGPFEKHRTALSRAVNTPGRKAAMQKRKKEEEELQNMKATGFKAVQQLLNAVRMTRAVLQEEPPAKKARIERSETGDLYVM